MGVTRKQTDKKLRRRRRRHRRRRRRRRDPHQKQKYPRMTLSPKIDVVEINTPWHFRYLQQVQMPIYTVSSPRPLEIGMNSLIL